MRLKVFAYCAWAKLSRQRHSVGFGGLCAPPGPHIESVHASKSTQEHTVPSASGSFWVKEALRL